MIPDQNFKPSFDVLYELFDWLNAHFAGDFTSPQFNLNRLPGNTVFSMIIPGLISIYSAWITAILAFSRDELEAVQHIAVNVKSSKAKGRLDFVRNDQA